MFQAIKQCRFEAIPPLLWFISSILKDEMEFINSHPELREEEAGSTGVNTAIWVRLRRRNINFSELSDLIKTIFFI